ncbi:MAG: universal stress protein [Chlorobi bacterium]|nr:universal stress protein [Chlorobiota bacterium]
MKNILSAIDFSPITAKVLEYTKKIAAAGNGKIRLLHVAEPPPEFLGEEFGPPVERDLRAEKMKKHHKKLDEIAETLTGEGFDVKPIIVQGSTVETILEQAKKSESDIIILGSHGKGPFAKMVMGSVTEGVIHKSRIPVLIIPHSLEETVGNQ